MINILNIDINNFNGRMRNLIGTHRYESNRNLFLYTMLTLTYSKLIGERVSYINQGDMLLRIPFSENWFAHLEKHLVELLVNEGNMNEVGFEKAFRAIADV